MCPKKPAVRTVDRIQVVTCFEVGHRIVEHEQRGTGRAEYGKNLLRDLATRLTSEFGTGFSKSNMEYMRRFYLMYQDRYPAIAQTVSGQSEHDAKSKTLSRKLPSPQKKQLSPLSRDKDGIRKLARKGQIIAKPQDLLKEPYVLEFLGLDEKSKYSETDLESAIIDKLEHFLLELGRGFLFEARQKRFTFAEDHFFVPRFGAL